MDSTTTLCFTCSQSANCGPHLNRLEDGRVCPTCAERFMEGLPSLLPGRAGDGAHEEVLLDPADLGATDHGKV